MAAVSEKTGEQVLCIALYDTDHSGLRWLVVEGSDGRPAFEDFDAVRVDVRYDQKQQAWHNVGLPPAQNETTNR